MHTNFMHTNFYILTPLIIACIHIFIIIAKLKVEAAERAEREAQRAHQIVRKVSRWFTIRFVSTSVIIINSIISVSVVFYY